MMTRVTLIALAAAVACAGVARAEENGGGTPMALTLADAVNRALASDAGYLSAQKDADAARAKISEARAAFIPTATLGATAMQILGLPTMVIPANSFGPGFPPEDVMFSTGYDRTVAAEATLTYLPYQGGREYAGYRLAKRGYELSSEALRQSRSNLIYDVAAAYYNVVLAEEAVRVVDTSVAVATSHVTATEDRYEAGLVSEYDVLRTRVQLTNLETARRHAEDGRVAATRYLLILLGLPAGTPVALKDRLTFNVERYNLDESIAAASAARPELRQMESSRLMAEDSVKLARGGDNPTVVFTADYTDYANAYSLNFADDWNDETTLALIVSWPVFDAFATRSRVRQARAEVAKTEFTKIRLAESVAMEVRGAWDNLATLEASVAAQKENVDFAERGLAIAQARYDAGLMSNLEVLDAQSALTQAEMGYFTALRDYELAKFAMRRARGDLAEATF